ncbi:MAG: hypothetical protein KGI27_08470 [Thaumarchaeota archaeon]|nr:hypothetical protein [Nitrososphaerota archaeon]
MLLPADISKKMLKEANLGISEKTLQRIKSDIKNLGIGHMTEKVHKIYMLTTMDSLTDAMKLKEGLFQIINDPDSNKREKIKASQVLFNILKGIPDLYDPEISESIQSAYNTEKNERYEASGGLDVGNDASQTGRNHDSGHDAIHDST